MATILPPGRPGPRRPDRPAILGFLGLALLAGVAWSIQARADAQVRRTLDELGRERADLVRRLDALQAILGRLDRTLPGDGHAAAAADSGRRATASST